MHLRLLTVQVRGAARVRVQITDDNIWNGPVVIDKTVTVCCFDLTLRVITSKELHVV